MSTGNAPGGGVEQSTEGQGSTNKTKEWSAASGLEGAGPAPLAFVCLVISSWAFTGGSLWERLPVYKRTAIWNGTARFWTKRPLKKASYHPYTIQIDGGGHDGRRNSPAPRQGGRD